MLFVCETLYAQEYSFRTLGNAEGLGNLAVLKIYQDRTGFFWLNEKKAGILAEFGATQQVFTSPRDKRTEDYITGRFG